VRPTCFKFPYVTTQSLPYSHGEASYQERYLDGGVLAEGQTIWLQSPRDMRSGEIMVPAFVEPLGVITLDVRFLMDIGGHVTQSLQSWKDPTLLLTQEADNAFSFLRSK
jgi:hypothetical protein